MYMVYGKQSMSFWPSCGLFVCLLVVDLFVVELCQCAAGAIGPASVRAALV